MSVVILILLPRPRISRHDADRYEERACNQADEDAGHSQCEVRHGVALGRGIIAVFPFVRCSSGT